MEIDVLTVWPSRSNSYSLRLERDIDISVLKKGHIVDMAGSFHATNKALSRHRIDWHYDHGLPASNLEK